MIKTGFEQSLNKLKDKCTRLEQSCENGDCKGSYIIIFKLGQYHKDFGALQDYEIYI